MKTRIVATAIAVACSALSLSAKPAHRTTKRHPAHRSTLPPLNEPLMTAADIDAANRHPTPRRPTPRRATARPQNESRTHTRPMSSIDRIILGGRPISGTVAVPSAPPSGQWTETVTVNGRPVQITHRPGGARVYGGGSRAQQYIGSYGGGKLSPEDEARYKKQIAEMKKNGVQIITTPP